ncbi:MAG: ATP-binding protein, partial [Burkholderiaceae bacterium]|nr:ATP-binding protein [Burkholderiaceae bacterium]
MSSQSYNESSIRVLKGLEPVRQRPGMYTRTENPLHIIQEVIDNAADEALGGFCQKIVVTLHADQSVSVEDNGRGIPVGLHPDEKAPVVELVFTRLHAGGKFDKQDGSGAYAFSGGLHGVGVSVTNALSTRLELEVCREGGRYAMTFEQGGVVKPLAKIGEVPKKTSGTKVRVWPDASFFDSPVIPLQELTRLLRSKAVLLAGVVVTFNIEKTAQTTTWCFEKGLFDYMSQTMDHSELLVPLFEGEQYADADDEQYAKGEG